MLNIPKMCRWIGKVLVEIMPAIAHNFKRLIRMQDALLQKEELNGLSCTGLRAFSHNPGNQAIG